MNHIFVTQDYAPDLGGMARRHVELVRRFSDQADRIEVSTVSAPRAADFDVSEDYSIDRRPFTFAEAKRFVNQMKWGAWLTRRIRQGVDVIHCGNLRPVGYAVMQAHLRTKAPFLVYVNGGDLLKELTGSATSRRKAYTARSILAHASGVVATSEWVGGLAAKLIEQLGIRTPPTVRSIHLGTDPDFFNPARRDMELRRHWAIGEGPMLLTVARLVPHKGQDVAIRSVAALKDDFTDLRYVIVGEGPDETRLRELAKSLGVADRVIFAGRLSDEEIADAYATATLYVGLSRMDRAIDAEGFGISFLEAAASGVPSVAGNSGGIPSAVRDGISGILVKPEDLSAVVSSVRTLLRDSDLRARMGNEARRLVETHYNWDRVAHETREFTHQVTDRIARRHFS